MKKYILLIISILILTSCGIKNTDSTNSIIETSNKNESLQSSENNTKPVEIPQVYNDEDGGKIEILKEFKDINETFESGPIKLDLLELQVGNYKPANENKELFDGKEVVNIVIIKIKTQNLSDETMLFYPNYANLLVNEKEEIPSNLGMSDVSLGEDYSNTAQREGKVVFITKTDPKDIKSLKFKISAPTGMDLTKQYEDIIFKYDI